MSSQSGNLHELAAYSGHPSSFILGAEAEHDHTSRHDFSQPASLPSDMGLRYMINSSSDDARFGPDTGTAHGPVYSIEGSLPNSSPSTVPFPPFPNVFQPSLSGPTVYSSSPSSFFSPSYCIPDIKAIQAYHGNPSLKSSPGYQNGQDIKSELGSFQSTPSPTMAPPTRSPHPPNTNSPATARELYISVTPQLRRASDILSRSPSASGTVRGLPLSPSSSSGFASPANLENPKMSPPLLVTENLVNIQAADGTNVRPEILGKIDKGFFMADNDWTCYRRNYFQLSCSFTLHPFVSIPTLHLHQGNSSLQIFGFSMSIAAVVDGRDGRAIELVQHTPKRDKGPQEKPKRVNLTPRPHPLPSMYGSSAPGGDTTMGGTRTMYESNYGSSSSNQPQTEYTFERIQFKQATANNGKRRAAQQYYHLIVELFVDLGSSMGDARWVKVAQRVSAPMVVRGRSPGHYQSERRPSNAGSAGGSAGGGGSYGSNSGMTPRQGDQMSLSTSGSGLQSGGYGSSYDQRSHYFPPPHASHIETPMEPIMSSEEIKAIDETDCYQYYPSTLFEGSIPHSRYRDSSYTLPSVNSHKIKHEYGGVHSHNHGHGHNSYNLPSLTAGAPLDSLGRQCGRFEGMPSSRGYFPAMFTHPEVNSS